MTSEQQHGRPQDCLTLYFNSTQQRRSSRPENGMPGAAACPPERHHPARRRVHPKIVQERLGHQTISVTLDTYSHVLSTLQRAAANAFGELLGRAAPWSISGVSHVGSERCSICVSAGGGAAI